jgi:hypothetical protein
MLYEYSCKYYCVVSKKQNVNNIYIANTSTINYFNNTNHELLSCNYLYHLFIDLKEALECSSYINVYAKKGKSVNIL